DLEVGIVQMRSKPLGGNERVMVAHDLFSDLPCHRSRARRSLQLVHLASEAGWLGQGRAWREVSDNRATSAPLLRLPFLNRAARTAPCRKPAADMRNRPQAHVLRGLRGEHRTKPARAMKDELLVLLKDRLGIRARRIDPEFEHAARAGE